MDATTARFIRFLAAVCVALTLSSCLDMSDWAEEIGPSIAHYATPACFPGFYVEAVWYEAAEDFGELDVLYAEDAVKPNHAEVQAALVLPRREDLLEGAPPICEVVVQLNEPGLGTMRDPDAEATAHAEVNVTTFMPRDVSREGREERKLLSYGITFRHNPELDEDAASVTFEILGTDPDTGEPAGQRHIVKIRLLDPPDLDDADAQPRDVDAPRFIVTSHTIEEVRPDEGE